MAKALADRLAEAFAEWLHARVRRELGLRPDESLSHDDIIAERYRGIRPAFGYPACPDHTEKPTLFALLDADGATGIALTESFAMLPAASVSRAVLRAPGATTSGRPDRPRPVEDYARRAGIDDEEAERWLRANSRTTPRPRPRRIVRRPMTVIRPTRPSRRALALPLALTLLLALLPGTAGTADAASTRHVFRENLAGPHDFVPQANFVQCVGASVQMMLNIVEPGSGRSRHARGPGARAACAPSGPSPAPRC